MFEKASRLKLRFETTKGHVTTEDLWDLPLTSATGKANLDDIARAHFASLRAQGDAVSFVTPAQDKSSELQLKFDIIKHVIDVKIAERDAANISRATREKKQKLLDIIDQKENAALTDMPLEELKRMVQAM